MNINNKIALVTGANRGIGKALVEALLARGAKRIYASARNTENLAELIALAPNVIVPIQLDVTNQQQIAQLTSQVAELDILINNAGIASGSNFTNKNTITIAQDEMNTHYFGCLNVTCALLSQLQQSQAAALINISSIAGISNFPLLAAYSASKAAQHSLTQGLRAELTKSGIRVYGVYPGPVDTRLAPGDEMPKASPYAVANAILNGLEQGTEDIYPDDFSQAMINIFMQSPKTLERQFAAALA